MTKNQKELSTVFKTKEVLQYILLLVYLPRLTLSDTRSCRQWHRDSE
jgi:hypothetical protein